MEETTCKLDAPLNETFFIIIYTIGVFNVFIDTFLNISECKCNKINVFDSNCLYDFQFIHGVLFKSAVVLYKVLCFSFFVALSRENWTFFHGILYYHFAVYTLYYLYSWYLPNLQ
jgi:hypothetical protein